MAVKTKKRKSQGRRRLTAKQVKYFGTKAQKAALKRKRSLAARPSARRKVATKRKVTRAKVKTETNWLATALAGAGGFAAGGALGTIFGDKVKSTLAGLPVIGQYFDSPASGDLPNMALSGISPNNSIALLEPARGLPGTESKVYQDYYSGFNQPQLPGAHYEIIGGMATIRGQRESDNAPVSLRQWYPGIELEGGEVN